jgi:uncharacterized protein (DUF2141 family)
MTVIVFRAVPPGLYAFAAYHDENNNGRIDIQGAIPREGLAFSNNAMGRNDVPAFAASAFRIVQASVVNVNMRYLVGH